MDDHLIQVLVLEHPLIRDLCKNILKKNTYEITDTSSESQALKLLEQKQFSIAIIDSQNLEFQQIAETCRKKKIEVIGLSDWTPSETSHMFPEIDATFIQKPFCLDEFYQGIKHAMNILNSSK